MSHRGRWYVPAFDESREELRALRADRVAKAAIGPPGEPRPANFDAVAFVTRTLARVPWAHEVEVTLHTDPATAARHFPPTLAELEPTTNGTRLTMRAESLDWAAQLLAGSGFAFDVHAPDELRPRLRALAERLLAA